jgi:malate dehydrogenase
MRRHKITVVGAGNVGATAAHWMAAKQLGDVVLVDIVEGLPDGKALDLAQAAPIEGFDCRLTGGTDYAATADSDIVVITSGSPRRPGMSRDDLLSVNAKIIRAVTGSVMAHSRDPILIVCTNPLDAMVYLAQKLSGLPAGRVMGMAGVLDSARFRTFVAMELGVSVQDVTAFVLGGHGDTMVPLPRYSTVAGIPLPDLLSADKIDAIVQRTRNGGAEIVGLLGTSAYFAPGAALAEMVEAIVFDKKRILPCAAFCQDEYGVGGYYVGVPAKLGAAGVEQIIQIRLADAEQSAFAKSVAAVKDLVAACEKLG